MLSGLVFLKMNGTESKGILLLNELEYVYDPFCEKAFWKQNNIDTFIITNPICALTGLVMTWMALFRSNFSSVRPEICTLSSFLFVSCKASLAVVGVGTAIFHSIDDQTNLKQLNFRLADRYSMICLCTSILILYSVKLFCKMGVDFFVWGLSLMYLYVLGLVLAVDSSTYEFMTLYLHDQSSETPLGNLQNFYETYMNICMLFPLGMIMVYATAATHGHTRRLVLWVWFWIAFNLGMWAANSYSCRKNPSLFILHAFFHITIAITFLFAACVGMTLDGEWSIEMYWCVWPMIRKPVSLIDNDVGKRCRYPAVDSGLCNVRINVDMRKAMI